MGLFEDLGNALRPETNWVCTDLDSNQYGRFLGGLKYEFKEDRVDDPHTGGKSEYRSEIDLSEYSREEIESAVLSYGYTYLGDYKLAEVDVNAAWIIAECLFELEDFSFFYV